MIFNHNKYLNYIEFDKYFNFFYFLNIQSK